MTDGFKGSNRGLERGRMTLAEAEAEGRRRFGAKFGQVRIEGSFLKGWLSDMLEAGFEPDYSEPGMGGLPRVEAGRVMEVECSYLKALERERGR